MEASRAIFLSYASQDSGAAASICQALRAAGIEVWFDQSELRGGDAWDQSIRRQIRNCALFIPVISRHTHERGEGYFRLEWKLAIDRSHLIMANKAFLLPVAIDDTDEDDENVPDKFREVQWTRLPGGETPAVFVERIQRLLSGEMVAATDRSRTADTPVAGVTPSPRHTRRNAMPRMGAVYGVVGVVAAIALGYFSYARLSGSGPGRQAIASIAVLPLVNESGEPSQQYFSDGISEDLITALSQFPGLKVIGRTSAFQFRDSKEDSREIGAKLGVAHLLEGSVRRSGELVRVSAELIDATDGSTQWSERYDRPFKDLFALQDEISRAVAGALRAKLLPGEHAAAQSERPPGGSLEAYNSLLQGRFYYLRRTEADYRKAIGFYTRSTELDPHYSLAWSELSRCWTTLSAAFLQGAPAREAYANARAAADRALGLAPDLAAAHVAQGLLLQDADLDWRGAESEYRRALALAPNDAEAKFFVGSQLATFGDVDQAIELTRQALATEPLEASWYMWLSVYLTGRNRLDDAEQAIRRAIELQPSASGYYGALTIIEIQRGHAQAAVAAAQRELPGVDQEIALGFAQQIAGDRSAADASLQVLIQTWADGAAYQIADIYALRKDARSTFEWLDRAWSTRDPGIRGLLNDPFILPYKDDPRFAAFCRKVSLPLPTGAKPNPA